MIKITLENINRKSPYKISLNNGDFDFVTDNGMRYSVSFLEDIPLAVATPINLVSVNEMKFIPLTMLK